MHAQQFKTRERRNARMLELVQIRGDKVFFKFCDVLHTTGHPLIADYLRGEGKLKESFFSLEKWPKFQYYNYSIAQ